MLMIEQNSTGAEDGSGSGASKEDVVSDLISAVEHLEQAVRRLRALASDYDNDFIERLMPGYDWSLEQIQELNAALIAEIAPKRR